MAGEKKASWAEFGEPRTVLSVIVLYCAAQFLGRFLLSPNLSQAEAMQMLFGQSFQWGYRPGHPPLMTWLSFAALSAAHNSRLALFLLREVILGIGLLAFYAAARTVLADARNAALALLFLLAACGTGWVLQASSMETVLLAAICCVYLLTALRALKSGALADYLLLGLASGLGVLSSYAFLILPLGMAGALALMPELRRRLRFGFLLLAGAIALAVITPYFALAPDAFSIARPHAPLLNALRDFLLALIVFALPALLIFAALYRSSFRPRIKSEGVRWPRFFAITMIASGIAAVAALLLFRVSDAEALIYPVLLPLPLYLFARREPMQVTADDRSDRIFAFAVLLCVVIGIVLRIAMYHTRAHDCRHCAPYWPLARFADTFRQAGFYGGTIAAPDAVLAGNLKLQFPESRAVTPDAPALRFGPAVPGPCLVVWEGEGNLPGRLRNYLTETYAAKLQDRAMQGDIEATLLTSKTRRARMNFLILADGVCNRPRG